MEPMLLWCPGCHVRHIDVGIWVDKPHHTHACQSCGMVWRPALIPTVGVQFLPGFKNEPAPWPHPLACSHFLPATTHAGECDPNCRCSTCGNKKVAHS